MCNKLKIMDEYYYFDGMFHKTGTFGPIAYLRGEDIPFAVGHNTSSLLMNIEDNLNAFRVMEGKPPVNGRRVHLEYKIQL